MRLKLLCFFLKTKAGKNVFRQKKKVPKYILIHFRNLFLNNYTESSCVFPFVFMLIDFIAIIPWRIYLRIFQILMNSQFKNLE